MIVAFWYTEGGDVEHVYGPFNTLEEASKWAHDTLKEHLEEDLEFFPHPEGGELLQGGTAIEWINIYEVLKP